MTISLARLGISSSSTAYNARQRVLCRNGRNLGQRNHERAGDIRAIYALEDSIRIEDMLILS